MPTMHPQSCLLPLAAFFCLVSTVSGSSGKLTSQVVSSCGTSGLNINAFGMTYYRADRQLEYRLVGNAQSANLSPNVTIYVKIYGVDAPTQYINLCDATRCPLSQSGFNIKGTQKIDADYADKLPAIAWSVPDLDAIATFIFDDGGRVQVACLKVSFTNGLSAKKNVVSWVTGGVTIGLMVVAALIAVLAGSSTAATSNKDPDPHGLIPTTPAPPPPDSTVLSPLSTNAPLPMSPATMSSSLPPPTIPFEHFGHIAGPDPHAFTWGAGGGAEHAISAGQPPIGSVPATGPDHLTFLGEPTAGAGTKAIGGAMGGDTAFQPHAPAAAHATASAGSHGPPAARMEPIMLFLHFQSISTAGLLSLKYPPLFQAFTVNFAWANFILPIASFKRTATHLRKCDLPNEQSAANGNGVDSLATPSHTSGLLLADLTGIEVYANRVNIPTQDISTMVDFVFLCACGLAIVLFFIIGVVIQMGVWMAKSPERQETWRARRTRWGQMSSNNTLRIMMLALSTLVTFSTYEWTLSCNSAVAIVLSAGSLAVVLANLGVVIFLVLRISRRPGGREELFSKETTYGRKWGTLYDTLNENKVYFLVPSILAVIFKGAIIGALQNHALAQVVIKLATEAIMAFALFYWQPYYSRGYNRVHYILAIGNVISNIILLLFLPSFSFNRIATSALAFVLLVIQSLLALMLAVLTVVKLGWGILWFRAKHHEFESRKQKEKRDLKMEAYGTPTSDHDTGKGDGVGTPRPISTALSYA